MSIESVMPSDHVFLCRPLLLLPSFFPNKAVFSGVSAGKEPACSVGDLEMWVRSLGQEGPLEKGMATHFSILAWRKSHGQRRLEGYSPGGCRELDATEQLTLSLLNSYVLIYKKVSL